MFVQELIAKLQEFDPNKVVVVDGVTQTVNSVEELDTVASDSVVCLNVISVVDFDEDDDED